MNLAIASVLFFLTFLGGCASQRYERGPTFNDFINHSIPQGARLKPGHLSYEKVYIGYANQLGLENDFLSWCHAVGGEFYSPTQGTWGSGVAVSFQTPRILFDLRTLGVGNDPDRPVTTTFSDGGCVLPTSGALLGAYAIYGHTVNGVPATAKFYTAAQAKKVHEASEKVALEYQKKLQQDSEIYTAKVRRSNECRAREEKTLLDNPQPGMSTSDGMIVFVKPPLVEIQTPDRQVWERIANLSVPSCGDHCCHLLGSYVRPIKLRGPH